MKMEDTESVGWQRAVCSSTLCCVVHCWCWVWCCLTPWTDVCLSVSHLDMRLYCHDERIDETDLASRCVQTMKWDVFLNPQNKYFTGDPSNVGVSNATGYERIAIFNQYLTFCRKWCMIELCLQQQSRIWSIEQCHFQRILTPISRWCHYLMLNISETAKDSCYTL